MIVMCNDDGDDYDDGGHDDHDVDSYGDGDVVTIMMVMSWW